MATQKWDIRGLHEKVQVQSPRLLRALRPGSIGDRPRKTDQGLDASKEDRVDRINESAMARSSEHWGWRFVVNGQSMKDADAVDARKIKPQIGSRQKATPAAIKPFIIAGGPSANKGPQDDRVK
jgi:hypothetical protein